MGSDIIPPCEICFSWYLHLSYAHAGENSIQVMFWLNFEPRKAHMDFGAVSLFSKFAWMSASTKLFSRSLIETHFSYRFFPKSVVVVKNNVFGFGVIMLGSARWWQRSGVNVRSEVDVRISLLTTTERLWSTLGSEVDVRISGWG